MEQEMLLDELQKRRVRTKIGISSENQEILKEAATRALGLTEPGSDAWAMWEKAETSLFHKALEKAVVDGRGSWEKQQELLEKASMWGHVFLLQRNWLRVVPENDWRNGEVQFPADICIFEAQVNGQRIILIKVYDDCMLLLEAKNGFACAPPYKWEIISEPMSLIVGQIKAACILLDAGVAEKQLIRAPYRLNKKREARGKRPIYSHHVLTLSHRKNGNHLESSGTDRLSPRLHFRRGHWRHYQNHKTWINWTLVGDEGLGFVDKDYAF